MLALPRVRVLVEVGAVEVDEPVRVTRKVRRHPVEDHADAATVEMVHKGHELPWFPVATRGGEVANGLITPRAVEGVFHHGQELDVGETHLADIVRELVRQLAIVEEAIAPLGYAPPRTEMHFVDRHRRLRPFFLAPLFHPIGVAPRIAFQIVNERRCRFSVLIKKRERIALEQERAGLRTNLEFVMRVLTNVRQK